MVLAFHATSGGGSAAPALRMVANMAGGRHHGDDPSSRRKSKSAGQASLKVFGATLTPFQGAGYYSAAGEAEREAINHWIRTSGAFDVVIDFDRAIRNPADPLRLLPAYDSRDHLHPNDAGYQVMADAVNLALFRA